MDDQKEIYRLWVEYLKRSDDYKEVCEWWERRQQEDSSLLPQNQGDPSEWYEIFLNYDEKLFFQAFLSKFKHRDLAHVFVKFFDIYRINFDDWWEWARLNRLGYTRPGPVEDYERGWNNIEKDLDCCIEAFIRDYGREPLAKEMKDRFLLLVASTRKSTMLLSVDLAHEPKDIIAEFKNIMGSDETKKRIAYSKPRGWCVKRRRIKPTGKPRIEDLQKYLDVYDLWKEKVENRKPSDPSGWDEIMQHFEPGRTVSNEGDRRLYQLYKQKAEKIISNVERGFFPGEY